MKLVIACALVACVGVEPPPPAPRQTPAFHPETACLTGTSAGVLLLDLAPTSTPCQPWRPGPDDLVIVTPLDTSHAMPPRGCRQVPPGGQAFLGDAHHPIAVRGSFCYAPGTVALDLVVDGLPVRDRVPLIAIAAGD